MPHGPACQFSTGRQHSVMMGLVAETVPGLLSSLESGGTPEIDGVPVIAADIVQVIGEERLPGSLGFATDLGYFRQRWGELLDRLHGYRRQEVILDNEPALMPIIDLYCPHGGSASLTYTRDIALGANAEISLLGPGFGNGYRLSLTESLTFDTVSVAKRLYVGVALTVTRYQDGSKVDRFRFDVNAPQGPVQEEIRDLDLEDDDPVLTGSFNPEFWIARQILTLRSATTGQGSTFTRKAKSESEWQVKIGDIPLLSQLGIKAAFKLKCAGADAIEYTFVLPYGHN
jgi:hypothetical protein